jgi:hypothetical protein
MRRVTWRAVVSVVLGVGVFGPPAWAQEINLMMGQMPVLTPVINDASPMRSVSWNVRTGRSYCVEVGIGDTEINNGNPQITVYEDDFIMVIGSNDNATTEPHGNSGSRFCYIPTASQAGYNVGAISDMSAGSHQYRVRVVETTLFSDWFYVGGDYSAYTLIRNTTDTPVAYRVNWRNGSGMVVATTGAGLSTVLENGDTFVDARMFPGALAATNGSVEIVHTGPPGAIVASTTVLSATTGLSFDAPFMTRPTW